MSQHMFKKYHIMTTGFEPWFVMIAVGLFILAIFFGVSAGVDSGIRDGWKGVR